MEHDFERSVAYTAKRGCPNGFRKRSEYTTAKGTYVPARCVRSTSPYEHNATRKMKARLEHVPTEKKRTVKCPRGYIARSPYMRRYSTSVRQKGYTVKRASGTVYKVYPKNTDLYVPPTCVKDKGLPGKGIPKGKGIGPLRKGEMTRFGYSSKDSVEKRRLALKKAVTELGALSVFRKLDAVAKLSLRVAPDSSRIFAVDRDWVQKTFGPASSDLGWQGPLDAF